MLQTCSTRPTFRSAFTLVELLVVITIIGVLVALLLPAVQAAREAARRTQCANQMRQMGLAILNYEDSKKELPPGGITEGPCCGTKSGTSWPIEILPQMELQSLYELYDHSEFNESVNTPNQQVRETFIPSYACPSDHNLDELITPASGPGSNSPRIKYARGSYRGNAGLCENGDFWDSPNEHGPDRLYERGPLHGVGPYVGVEDPVKLAYITDGTTNTVLLGEKSHTWTSEEGKRRQTFWAYTYTSYNKSCTFEQTRAITGDYDRCLRIGGEFGSNPCKRSWGSLHPSGLYVAMCDASVQWVSSDVDIFIFGDLATIAGEELASLGD